MENFANMTFNPSLTAGLAGANLFPDGSISEVT
jgi:hypothetical protein